MPSNRRFERIAHDLEKLPCELHDAVLADLEFGQLIRLSNYAGSRLIWSLENSLSPWGKFFQNGAMTEWQKYLEVTDHVKTLCFMPPKKKGVFPHIFERGALSFLHHRSSDWTSKLSLAHREGLVDRESLSHHWLYELNEVITRKVWSTFHENYSKLIEPWIPHLKQAHNDFLSKNGLHPVDIFRKFTLDASVMYNLTTCKLRSLLLVDELIAFINIYQELRRTRADALAMELYRLAELYEAHPMRLKMPFAPETNRWNRNHIPENMRYEARKLIKKAKYSGWRDGECRSRFRFAFLFPALVPYDWSMRFFVSILRSHKLSESLYPKEIVEKHKIILEQLPRWVKGAPENELLYDKTSQTRDVSKAFQLLRLNPETFPHIRVVTEAVGDAYYPHENVELEWLETFVEVIKWMEKEFPDVLQEVRGDGWKDER